jgi:hypothetical protein
MKDNKCSGKKLRGCDGTTVRWYDGTTVRRYDGATAKRLNGKKHSWEPDISLFNILKLT